MAERLAGEMRAMELDDTWEIRCATITPDHLHMLVVLGQRLSLSKVIQRLKAKTALLLRTAALQWERGFFDRQLRTHDEELAVFHYVYLNPYRNGICKRDQQWPWFYCHDEDWRWMRNRLDRELPPPEWLG